MAPPGPAHAVPTLVLSSRPSGHSVAAQNAREGNPVWLHIPQSHGYICHLRQSGQEQIHEHLTHDPEITA